MMNIKKGNGMHMKDEFEIVEEKEAIESFSVLHTFGEELTAKTYITDPAIAREQEIKEMILVLLTPEKSANLVGKPGIGKTAIVEGLAYRIQRGMVPDALKNKKIWNVNTVSMLGSNDGQMRVENLVKELKNEKDIILFIDEIHMVIGANSESSVDIANMLKPGLDRGTIKIIGATTSDEYDRYLVRDRAFIRRFVKIEVAEPTPDITVQIIMGSLPKIEKQTGVKLKYNDYVSTMIVTFLVEATTEYKRVFELSSRYPDIVFTLVTRAFSFAVYDNRKEVTLTDVYKALCTAQSIYPDVIEKEKIRFQDTFQDILKEEGITLE